MISISSRAFLVLFAIIGYLRCCSASAASTTYTTVVTDLRSSTIQQFKSCVESIRTQFIFAVDGDQMIVLPPMNATISSVDEAAIQACIATVSSFINIAYEDGHSSLHEYTGPYSLNELDLPTLDEAGVAGLGLTPTNSSNDVNSGRRDVSRRSNTDHFLSLGASDKTCTNYDSEANVYNECISKDDSYGSIKCVSMSLFLGTSSQLCCLAS